MYFEILHFQSILNCWGFNYYSFFFFFTKEIYSTIIAIELFFIYFMNLTAPSLHSFMLQIT